MNNFFKVGFFGGIIGLIASTAVSQEYNFKFQTSDPAGSPTFQILEKWTDRLTSASDGRLVIQLMPVGTIVAYNETLDAVGAGILDGHITDPGYFSGKDPALALIGNTVGAWSSPYEMLRYINYGGGKQLMNELYEPYGVHFIGASSGGLEAFVSKKPLDGVEDLKGLKLRAPEGLVNEIFAAAGAVPVNLPSSEVYTSLDKGVIDAADYTVFSVNESLGLHDLAPHPVYPGFHSMPLLDVSMNKSTWDSLPKDLRVLLSISISDLALDMTSKLAMADLKAVSSARQKGTIIHDWSQEERAKFRGIARDKWLEVAGRNANAQKVYDSITTYLTEQGLLQ